MTDEGRPAIGIDIGGTNTKLGLVTRDGQITGFRSFATHAQGHDPSPFLTTLRPHVAQLVDLAQGQVVGVGISTHGYLRPDRHGPLVCFSTPALASFDMHAWIRENFALPVAVENDLIAHALAEYTFGVGRGSRRFMCLAIGTGFGAGVIVDGEPVRLVGGTTGDAGRIVIEPGGPKCAYGVSGSAEAMCGVSSIERLALKCYGRPVAAHEVIAAARRGDDLKAAEIMQEIGRYVGLTLGSLCAIFLPERVALSGGVAEAGTVLLEACCQRFNELAGEYHQTLRTLANEFYAGVEIVLGETRFESGVLGSVIELFQVKDKGGG